MDNIQKGAIVAVIGVVGVLGVFSVIWYIPSLMGTQTGQTSIGTEQNVQDNACSRLDYQIEQEIRPEYETRLTQYESELMEYNKKWLPAPSYTSQMEAMYDEVIMLEIQLNTLVDQFNAECVG
jgi:hypothetical protein